MLVKGAPGYNQLTVILIYVKRQGDISISTRPTILVHIMACRLLGGKPQSGPMLAIFQLSL